MLEILSCKQDCEEWNRLCDGIASVAVADLGSSFGRGRI